MAPACGDFKKLEGEECDDSNSIDDDGCSNLCTLTPGYTCTGGSSSGPDTLCTYTCGNGKREVGEQCDNELTGTNGDGCSEYCKVENGYTCTGGTPTTIDTCVNSCGDSLLVASEECDDGNQAIDDGCSKTC